jgi:hypothetical protein
VVAKKMEPENAPKVFTGPGLAEETLVKTIPSNILKLKRVNLLKSYPLVS